MFRSLFCTLAVFVLAAADTPGQSKSAFDKPTLEAYVRHMYVMDKQVEIHVGDPKPAADLPGFSEVTVSASMGQAHQDFRFFVSKDGSKIVQGTVFDVNQNPFKRELDKLKTEGAPGTGTQGAPVVLVEFSDFECPYCKNEASVLRQNLISSYPKEVHFYFKQFPLASIHPWSRAAAIASRCIYRQNADAFWNYHDWIFEKQSEITPENLKDKVMEWAKGQKGIDSLQVAACMDNKATESEVDADIAQGRALGVDSTPTLFINGRKMAASVDWPTLRAIIDYEIEYQKTAKNAGEDCGCVVKLDLPGAQQTPPPPGSVLRKK